MALYLSRFKYSVETWDRLMNSPEDRREAARTAIETVGGKLDGFWYSFGEYDGFLLWEARDNIAASAVAIAVNAGGAITKFETTVLISVEEALSALRKAQSVAYRPPGKK